MSLPGTQGVVLTILALREVPYHALLVYRFGYIISARGSLFTARKGQHSICYTCHYLLLLVSMEQGDPWCCAHTQTRKLTGDSHDLRASLSGISRYRLYPGHGPVVDAAEDKIRFYISHRQEREDQILDTMAAAKGRTLSSLQVYYCSRRLAGNTLGPCEGQADR